MNEMILSFIAGGALAASITGIFSIVLYKIKRQDKVEDDSDNIKKALRYIMLYIIQERAEHYIARGEITIDERRSLHKWHDLYHNGLNGNGDADLLMSEVDELPTKPN